MQLAARQAEAGGRHRGRGVVRRPRPWHINFLILDTIEFFAVLVSIGPCIQLSMLVQINVLSSQ